MPHEKTALYTFFALRNTSSTGSFLKVRFPSRYKETPSRVKLFLAPLSLLEQDNFFRNPRLL